MDRLFSHRPARYGSVASWLVAGTFRDWRGITAAFIGGWLNLPFAVLMAVFGGVSGAFYGFVGTIMLALDPSLNPMADLPVIGTATQSSLFQAGGVLGALIGAVVGTISGFLFGLLGIWALLYQHDPAVAFGAFIGQVITAAILAGIYTIVRIAAEPWFLKLGGARRMSRREADLLMPIVHECAERLHLGNVPMVLMDDSRDVNAYAVTRHIVINQGLLDEFNYEREPIAGVIAHELAHWANGDSVNSIFVRGVALPLYIGYTIVTAIMRVVRSPLIQGLLLLIAWPITVTVQRFVVPMEAADSRAAEYQADQAAAMAGHRAGIRQVLARLRRTVDGSRNGWDLAICASHPPNELRLERLEEPGRTYPLPDPDAPAMPIPVAVTGTLQKD
ncbi:zinc metalloprotease HtpX [Micromonospora sonneratiae]|uniref:M48 family metalloprotease n=1 Tax=Micromonospora sonneratiae TaxID=1184706 RepID=A0ABW3YDL8_9ACTN